jgi:hypothetical protein
VRVRTIAAGVTLAALAGTAVPLALSGAASAKGSGTPTTVAITKCTPAIATIGKTVTIHGTDLSGVTKVTIGGSKNLVTAGSVVKNTAKAIKINPVPGGIATTPNATTKIVVTTPSGSATQQCNFKKAAKKKSHKG